MRYLIILFLTSIIFSGCNHKNRNDSIKKSEIVELDTLKVDKVDFKEVSKIAPSITIMEYDQWNRLLETVITNNGIFRYEKNWQNGEIIKERLHIKLNGFFSQIEEMLMNNFCRNQDYYEEWNDNTYIVHLEIKKENRSPLNISFKNCKSIELERLVSIINKQLPEKEHILLKGKNVVDTFVSSDSIKTWDDLKSIANYNNLSTYKLQDIDRNKTALLDSTIFGKVIFRTYSLKSSYLVSVKNNIGKYYPCIILGEQYDSDDITKFLAIFMIDSTFNEIGDFEFISGYGSDSEVEWNYFGTQKDSLLQIEREDSYECYEGIEGVSKIHLKEFYKMTIKGQLEEIKTDTLEIRYCG